MNNYGAAGANPAQIGCRRSPLEEAISCFQDGMEYIKICQTKLTAAEGKLKLLKGEEFVDLQQSI